MGPGCRRRRRSFEPAVLAAIGVTLLALAWAAVASAAVDDGGGGGEGGGGGGGGGGNTAHVTETAISCLAVQLEAGTHTTCTATVVDTLNPPSDIAGKVAFSSEGPADILNPLACDLQKVGVNQFTCSVDYKPGLAGIRHLLASYEGETGHTASTSDPLEVTVTPAPEPGGGGGSGGGGGGSGGGNEDGGGAMPPSTSPPVVSPPVVSPPVVSPPAEGPASAPNTTLMGQVPRKMAKRRAKFVFGSDQTGSTFQCRLDVKPYAACPSPYWATVKLGRHTLRVRAVNRSGIADPTPLVVHWKVA